MVHLWFPRQWVFENVAHNRTVIHEKSLVIYIPYGVKLERRSSYAYVMLSHRRESVVHVTLL